MVVSKRDGGRSTQTEEEEIARDQKPELDSPAEVQESLFQSVWQLIANQEGWKELLALARKETANKQTDPDLENVLDLLEQAAKEFHEKQADKMLETNEEEILKQVDRLVELKVVAMAIESSDEVSMDTVDKMITQVVEDILAHFPSDSMNIHNLRYGPPASIEPMRASIEIKIKRQELISLALIARVVNGGKIVSHQDMQTMRKKHDVLTERLLQSQPNEKIAPLTQRLLANLTSRLAGEIETTDDHNLWRMSGNIVPKRYEDFISYYLDGLNSETAVDAEKIESVVGRDNPEAVRSFALGQAVTLLAEANDVTQFVLYAQLLDLARDTRNIFYDQAKAQFLKAKSPEVGDTDQPEERLRLARLLRLAHHSELNADGDKEFQIQVEDALKERTDLSREPVQFREQLITSLLTRLDRFVVQIPSEYNSTPENEEQKMLADFDGGSRSGLDTAYRRVLFIGLCQTVARDLTSDLLRGASSVEDLQQAVAQICSQKAGDIRKHPAVFERNEKIGDELLDKFRFLVNYIHCMIYDGTKLGANSDEGSNNAGIFFDSASKYGISKAELVRLHNLLVASLGTANEPTNSKPDGLPTVQTWLHRLVIPHGLRVTSQMRASNLKSHSLLRQGWKDEQYQPNAGTAPLYVTSEVNGGYAVTEVEVNEFARRTNQALEVLLRFQAWQNNGREAGDLKRVEGSNMLTRVGELQSAYQRVRDPNAYFYTDEDRPGLKTLLERIKSHPLVQSIAEVEFWEINETTASLDAINTELFLLGQKGNELRVSVHTTERARKKLGKMDQIKMRLGLAAQGGSLENIQKFLDDLRNFTGYWLDTSTSSETMLTAIKNQLAYYEGNFLHQLIEQIKLISWPTIKGLQAKASAGFLPEDGSILLAEMDEKKQITTRKYSPTDIVASELNQFHIVQSLKLVYFAAAQSCERYLDLVSKAKAVLNQMQEARQQQPKLGEELNELQKLEEFLTNLQTQLESYPRRVAENLGQELIARMVAARDSVANELSDGFDQADLPGLPYLQGQLRERFKEQKRKRSG